MVKAVSPEDLADGIANDGVGTDCVRRHAEVDFDVIDGEVVAVRITYIVIYG